jgi:cytochrome b subunit of formate dehydrogenase
MICATLVCGVCGGVVVEALCYKPEGLGFDSRWCHWIFFFIILSGLTMALGSTQTLTEMSTRNISWGLNRQVHRADSLATFMCQLSQKALIYQ